MRGRYQLGYLRMSLSRSRGVPEDVLQRPLATNEFYMNSLYTVGAYRLIPHGSKSGCFVLLARQAYESASRDLVRGEHRCTSLADLLSDGLLTFIRFPLF